MNLEVGNRKSEIGSRKTEDPSLPAGRENGGWRTEDRGPVLKLVPLVVVSKGFGVISKRESGSRKAEIGETDLV